NDRRSQRFSPRNGAFLSGVTRGYDSSRRYSSGQLFVAGTWRRTGSIRRAKVDRAQSRGDQRRARGKLRWFGCKIDDGRSIPAATLIWTAGVKPSDVIASLPVAKEKNRIRVDANL